MASSSQSSSPRRSCTMPLADTAERPPLKSDSTSTSTVFLLPTPPSRSPVIPEFPRHIFTSQEPLPNPARATISSSVYSQELSSRPSSLLSCFSDDLNSSGSSVSSAHLDPPFEVKPRPVRPQSRPTMPPPEFWAYAIGCDEVMPAPPENQSRIRKSSDISPSRSKDYRIRKSSSTSSQLRNHPTWAGKADLDRRLAAVTDLPHQKRRVPARYLTLRAFGPRKHSRRLVKKGTLHARRELAF